MKRVISVVFLSVLASGFALAEEPVQFADPILKAAVEEALWIFDPTPTDMLALTSLNVENMGIHSLGGLEYATNLQTLVIRWNHITNLSPLSGLTNLRVLDAHNNGLSDLSPLAGLVNLRRLVLRINNIGGISALSTMVSLEEAHLEWNDISSLSSLCGLPALRYVDLRHNCITDACPLMGALSLHSIDLEGNPLSKTSREVCIPQILASIPGIIIFYDAYPIRHRLTISSGPGGQVTFPGTGMFIYEEIGTVVRLEATADPSFRFSHWSGTCSGPDNPMVIIMDQDHEIRANFVSLLDTLHVDDDAPGDPQPCDPAGSDAMENGSAQHPFDRIQEAIEVATRGATVLVHPGTYVESIDFLGKSITVTGENPESPNDVGWPVIQGVPDQRVVTLAGEGDTPCLLHGLVLTGGNGQMAGGIWCSNSQPTIANCLIVGNRASDPNGATVYCVDSNAVLVNCTMADNLVGARGAALCSVNSHVAVVNSILWGDIPGEILQLGTHEVSARYSIVAGGWTGPGNMDADPLFAAPGRWIDPNDPGATVEPDDPDTTWVMGDYHVRSQTGRWKPDTASWVEDAATSPCVDTGDPDSPIGPEPSPNGEIINIGAYGGTTEASMSSADVSLP